MKVNLIFPTTMLLLIFLIGCGNKIDNLRTKIRQECFGSLELKCVNLKIDLEVAKYENALNIMQKKEKQFSKCRDTEDFEKAIKLIKSGINYYEDSRPGFIERYFSSGGGFASPKPYPHNSEIASYLKLACLQIPKNGEELPHNTTTTSKKPTDLEFASITKQQPQEEDLKVRACTDEKISQFRLSNGDEALIRHDMLEEWASECKEK